MAGNPCAHCDNGPNDRRASMDDGRAVRCPACDELICPSCRAMSGPSTCGSYADGDENAADIATEESPEHTLDRLAAYRRAKSPHVAGLAYPLNHEVMTRARKQAEEEDAAA